MFWISVPQMDPGFSVKVSEQQEDERPPSLPADLFPSAVSPGDLSGIIFDQRRSLQARQVESIIVCIVCFHSVLHPPFPLSGGGTLSDSSQTILPSTHRPEFLHHSEMKANWTTTSRKSRSTRLHPIKCQLIVTSCRLLLDRDALRRFGR